jgi:hypothetical protein
MKLCKDCLNEEDKDDTSILKLKTILIRMIISPYTWLGSAGMAIYAFPLVVPEERAGMAFQFMVSFGFYWITMNWYPKFIKRKQQEHKEIAHEPTSKTT